MFVCVWWWVKKMVVGWVVRSVPGMCVLASSVCKDFVHASVKTHTHSGVPSALFIGTNRSVRKCFWRHSRVLRAFGEREY